MKNLVVALPDLPGTLANMTEALGKAGVNMEGICRVPSEGKAMVHILIEDVSNTRQVLEEEGIQIEDEIDVLVIECKNQLGKVGKITRKIADVGVNINLVYIASRNRLVLGVDDMDKARTALKYDPLFFKEFIKGSH